MVKPFRIIIPARMHSTRLPRKMLLDVGGLPLVVRVARQAQLSQAQQVIIATDHVEIFQVCQEYGHEVIMTSTHHQSGTDRSAEVVQKLGLNPDEIIINVQGDEPLIDPLLINQLAEFAAAKQSPIATIAHPITTIEEIFNPNIVKTVLNQEQMAIYFSRAPIPYYRDGYAATPSQTMPTMSALRHIGIYAYQVSFLNIYQQLPSCTLEQIEALEQLRALYHGYAIAVLTTTSVPPPGIDTQQDLEHVRALIAKQ